MTEDDAHAHESESTLPADHAFVCDRCDRRWYYTRARCPACGCDDSSTYELGTGELLARTAVAVTPPDVRSPNDLGLAEFGDVRLIAQLDTAASVGDRVAFAGSHRLRDGDRTRHPRLTVVE